MVAGSSPKEKLLIVDDEVAAMAALERSLRGDFDVLKASSAQEALDLIEKERPKILLTDYRMPEMSGIELLRRVALRHPSVVRTIITGHIEPEVLASAINENLIHRFFLKPWDNEMVRLQMLECLKLAELIQQKDILERLSITDPVTGLTNHRYFQDQLRKEVDRSRRHQRAMTLIMIDVDHFKEYNDKNGHPKGDAILHDLAQVFLGAVRNLDQVSRYGGEEFAIILPDTAKTGATEVAERIRSQVEARLPLTVSLGVAEFSQDPGTAEDVLKRADAALYRAKSQGRNQVSFAD